jgi:predicted esterase
MVGATWMTREDREFEIQDYVRYLDAVVEDIGPVPSTTVLGFSQGVATAARWVVLGWVQPDRLILWGDYLPPDLDMELASSALEDTELVIIRGNEDPALDEESKMKEEERLQSAGITYQVLVYSGGHEIDPQPLSQLATQS